MSNEKTPEGLKRLATHYTQYWFGKKEASAPDIEVDVVGLHRKADKEDDKNADKKVEKIDDKASDKTGDKPKIDLKDKKESNREEKAEQALMDMVRDLDSFVMKGVEAKVRNLISRITEEKIREKFGDVLNKVEKSVSDKVESAVVNYISNIKDGLQKAAPGVKDVSEADKVLDKEITKEEPGKEKTEGDAPKSFTDMLLNDMPKASSVKIDRSACQVYEGIVVCPNTDNPSTGYIQVSVDDNQIKKLAFVLDIPNTDDDIEYVQQLKNQIDVISKLN
jgi:hypothetical protein